MLKGIRLGPTSLKHSARQFADAWASVRRSRALERAIRTLRHAVRAGRVSPDVCQELRVAWGNPGWTADAEFLAAVASRAPGHGPVLECGSGLTTLILGVIADEHGSNVWTLEQDHRWSRYMDGVLRRFAIRSVALWHAPLVGRGDFVWFDLGPRVTQHRRPVADDPSELRRQPARAEVEPDKVAAPHQRCVPERDAPDREAPQHAVHVPGPAVILF
ncbi:MAG TPA: hypothetical protein VIW26_12870, partial [Gemmatimonadales bacterium]